MHRNNILSLFDLYERRFPAETAVIDRIRAFVTAHEDCFKRELLEGHITGSAWVLNASRQCVLLTHHRKLDIWVQLGGHADGDTDVMQVAMREAREESGLEEIRALSPEIFDIDIHSIPARGHEPEHFHYDCRFLLMADTVDDYAVSDESHDLAWIPLEKVTDYTTEDSIIRMLGKTRDWV